MNVPFVDLKAQHRALKYEILSVIESALVEAQFVGGQAVSAFEQEFAAFCGAPFAVGVNSGTDALLFSLIASGIKPGDEIITTPNTFIATTEAISQAGGHIVFVDIDPSTQLMDAEKLRVEVKNRLSKGNPLRAILPVHLYGQVAEMKSILDVAQEFNLIVLEDACQAHGAVYLDPDNPTLHGKKAGTMGLTGSFSFYPGKNLGSCGEGGAVVTRDEPVAAKIQMLRDHGQREKYIHEIEGYNGRLHAWQAGILRVKLKYLAGWNEKRRNHAKLYRKLLADAPGVTLPAILPWSESVYHVFVIMVNNRDAIQAKLKEKGVATGLHYPIPLHLQEAYRHLGYKRGDFPHTEANAERILSLPMFPELTEEQITYVVQCLKESLG